MKRKQYLSLFIVLSLLFVGCGSESSNISNVENDSSMISVVTEDVPTDNNMLTEDNSQSSAETIESGSVSEKTNSVLEKVAEIPREAIFYNSKEIDSAIYDGIKSHDKMTDKYTILNYLRENILNDEYDKTESIMSGKNSYQLVYKYENLPNWCGLVKTDGTILIPYNAAIIKSLPDSDERYVLVTYATDEVFDEKDAYLFSFDYEGLVGIQWNPDDNDKLYDGYSVVYDLYNERFVNGIRIEDTNDSVRTVGKNIWLSTSLGEGTLYTSDGSAILQGKFDVKSTDNENYLISMETRDEYIIYDEDGKELTKVRFYPTKILNENRFVIEQSPDGYMIVDDGGNQVGDIKWALIPNFAGKFLYGRIDRNSSYYVITDLDGKIICNEEAKVTSVNYKDDYVIFEQENGEYGLVYSDGTVFYGISDHQSAPFYCNEEDKGKLFAFDKGDVVVLDGRIDSLSYTDSYVECRNENNKYALYDTARGEMVLDYKYSEIRSIGTYIYARADDNWEVYKILE